MQEMESKERALETAFPIPYRYLQLQLSLTRPGCLSLYLLYSEWFFLTLPHCSGSRRTNNSRLLALPGSTCTSVVQEQCKVTQGEMEPAWPPLGRGAQSFRLGAQSLLVPARNGLP